jgi:hypothetical protein
MLINDDVVQRHAIAKAEIDSWQREAMSSA